MGAGEYECVEPDPVLRRGELISLFPADTGRLEFFGQLPASWQVAVVLDEPPG